MKKLMVLATVIVLTSCGNEMVRKYGGSETLNLKEGERLVNITWKESDLWILTKKDTTKPSTYTFREESNRGILNGSVIIIEK